MLRAQYLPGIERCSKVESGGTFGSLQHLKWVVYEVLGQGRRKAQLWVCHCSAF